MYLQNSTNTHHSLLPDIAQNLAHSTISEPIMEEITPRWLLNFLPWVAVEAGKYRINKHKRHFEDTELDMVDNEGGRSDEEGLDTIELSTNNMGEHKVSQTFPDYIEKPINCTLSLLQTMLRLNTQVTDIFNKPMNQTHEQMRLTIEAMKERQEWEILNNKDFGLISNVSESMKVKTRNGPPTPDDMDELLSKVWKKPAFFLAHPKAIAAFGRECTKRGVPPPYVNFSGSPFITWRGVPIIPSDKMLIKKKGNNDKKHCTTSILLMRVGEKEQGVIGLHQPGVPHESYMPSLSVKYCGIDSYGISSYLLNLYFSIAVLAEDAVGVLKGVEVDHYYDYD